MYKKYIKRFFDVLISGIALLLIGWFLKGLLQQGERGPET